METIQTGIGETLATEEVVEQAQEHPFEFGYVYPLEKGLTESVWRGNYLEITYAKAQLEDEIWYGNCIDDVIITSKYLHQHLPSEASISLFKRIYHSMFDNSATFIHHYTVLVEHLRLEGNSVLKDIDHSLFYSKYLNALEKNVDDYEMNIRFHSDEEYGTFNTNLFFPLNEFTLPNLGTVLTMGKIEREEKEVEMVIQVLELNGKRTNFILRNNIRDLNKEMIVDQIESRLVFNPNLSNSSSNVESERELSEQLLYLFKVLTQNIPH